MVLHHLQQAGDLLSADQRFVALHVDVNLGGLSIGYFVHPLGSAAVLR